MTNELANVPELRFTGFEDKWEETNLGNIANIVGGGTPKTEIPEYWNGEINWYSPVEIGDRNYVYESKNKITQLGLKKSSAKILPIGTVLFTARAGIGNTAILKKEGATNQGFQSIIPKEGVLDTYFIFSRTNELKRYGEIHGAGSTFVEISGKEMAKMPISIPVIKEQQKIGDFFSKLDRQIELEEQKLSLLEEQKKGYMQKLFSQELRFKDENGDDYPEWMETNIRNTFDNKGGTALEKEFDNNGTHKVISIGSYSMNSTYNEQNLRINKNEFTEKYLLNEGDLAMVLNDKTKEGNIIGKSIYIDEDDKYIYNQRTERLIPVTGNNHKFLWYLMNSEQFRKKIKQMMQGATQVYINYNSIKDLSIYLPILEEQNKIENFLGDIFNIIKNQSDKVELLKRRKKGFLQKMFV